MNLKTIAFVFSCFVVQVSCNQNTKYETKQSTDVANTPLVLTVGNVSFNLIKVDGFEGKGSFRMMETEVTQALWEAVMGTNPSHFKGCPDCPVENVNYSQVSLFIDELNKKTGQVFRLPSKLEWQYAASGGNKSKKYAYAGSDSVDLVAWYAANSSKKTQPVKGKQPNELGFYDMNGNVKEWCLQQVACSCSWGDSYTDDCKDTLGKQYDSDIKLNVLGFRLLLPIDK